MKELLELSDYFTLVVIVPESHADIVRKVMGEAGAGETVYLHLIVMKRNFGRIEIPENEI